MKLEIDLNDILGDEYGAETLQESVRRQVVVNLTRVVKEGVGKTVEAEVSKVINEEISEAVKAQMPSIVADLLDAEYVKVDRWGDRTRDKTTFRKELVAAVHEQMKYERKNWDSEKNAFTRAVDEVIGENIKEFKAEFRKQIDGQLLHQAMEYATKGLAERLKVKAG